MEIWKGITEFEGNYEVSNLGRVRSVERILIRSNGTTHTRVSKVLKPATDGNGYLRCALSFNGKLYTRKVHRLVAQAFIENDVDGLVVNHLNFNRQDNRVENLEWCTALENANHSIKAGRFQMKADDALRLRSVNNTPKAGSLNGIAKLTEDKVVEILKKYTPTVYTRKMLAEEYGVMPATIKDIVNRRSWKHVTI